MAKIKVKNPVVEMDGDEMTRIIWQLIKDKLIHPYLDIDLLYYDLSIQNRDETNDQITIDAANKTREVGCRGEMRDHHAGRRPGEGIRPEGNVAVAERHHPQHPGRHHLPRADHLQEHPAPRAGLDPADRRSAVTPIGDQYRATDFKFPGKGTLTIKFTGDDGKVIEKEVFKAPGSGVAMAMYNLDDSIRDFRAGLVQLRAQPRLFGLSLHQEHHPEAI